MQQESKKETNDILTFVMEEGIKKNSFDPFNLKEYPDWILKELGLDEQGKPTEIISTLAVALFINYKGQKTGKEVDGKIGIEVSDKEFDIALNSFIFAVEVEKIRREGMIDYANIDIFDFEQEYAFSNGDKCNLDTARVFSAEDIKEAYRLNEQSKEEYEESNNELVKHNFMRRIKFKNGNQFIFLLIPKQ